MTVKELIQELKKYDEQTEVCSGYFDEKGGWYHGELVIKESLTFADRIDEELLLWIGCEDEIDF